MFSSSVRLEGLKCRPKKLKEQSATCVAAASHREDKPVVPERRDVHRISVVFHKAFHGDVNNAFASSS